MRRNPIRLALVLAATTFLAACADLATGPAAPQGPRFDDVAPATDSVQSDTTNALASNHQGSQI